MDGCSEAASLLFRAYRKGAYVPSEKVGSFAFFGNPTPAVARERGGPVYPTAVPGLTALKPGVPGTPEVIPASMFAGVIPAGMPAGVAPAGMPTGVIEAGMPAGVIVAPSIPGVTAPAAGMPRGVPGVAINLGAGG
mmetsp:Transcript_1083/g.3022  ORF Transcript_1083/g.3022 Transcript_1083/m.3022 type:complete len:136 (+) Transcript_1083:271-678(+)